MAGPKPFMVCGISTKWHGPKTYKTPVRKLSWAPPGTSIEERSSGPRRDLTKQASRSGCSPTVIPNVDRRRPLPKPQPQPGPLRTTKVQKPLPLCLTSSAGRSLPGKTFMAKPLATVARLKEDKRMGRCPESVRSTQDMTAKELPPRPSCVPRIRNYRFSVGATALKGNRDVVVKVSTAAPHNFVNKLVVASNCCTETSARNRRLTTYPHTVEPASPIVSSLLASPEPPSSPSQSWKIDVHVHVKQIKTPMSLCDDEILCSMDNARNSRVTGIPKYSPGRSEFESAFSSPAVSSSPTIVETPASLADPMVGVDGLAKISTETKDSPICVSDTFCAATSIPPSRNSTVSMAKLASVMDGSAASSPPTLSDNGDRALKAVRGAIETAREIFSPPRRASRFPTETTSSKAMGTDAKRIRKVVIPPLDKDAKVSKNPTTQMEIEMLRVRRRAAGGGVVYSRLDHLGSLTAMAIVTKIGTSIPDSRGRV